MYIETGLLAIAYLKATDRPCKLKCGPVIVLQLRFLPVLFEDPQYELWTGNSEIEHFAHVVQHKNVTKIIIDNVDSVAIYMRTK